MRAVTTVLAWVGLSLLGCGSDAEGPPTTGVGGSSPDGCAPGERTLDDGTCQPAGIPAGACAQGFEHLPTHGTSGYCVPIVPAQPCPAGTMAVPGETECREIAPCGAGTWGDVPRDGTTEHVDASYTGGASDGTEAQPWTTIAEGVAAAEPGAIVAIAAGSYPEYLWIENKAVRLWGVCPALVEIVGLPAEQTAVFFAENAHGSEVRDLAVRGPGAAVVVSGSLDVVLDRLWLHDTGSQALHVQNAVAPASAALSGSLVEAAAGTSAVVLGSELSVTASVVRNGVAAGSHGGRGFSIQYDEGARGALQMAGSLVENNGELGVSAFGSDLQLSGSVVRWTQPHLDGTVGGGVVVSNQSLEPHSSSATITGSVIDGNRFNGIRVDGGDLTLERSVVSNTAMGVSSDGIPSGAGIAATAALATPSSVEVRESALLGNTQYGLRTQASPTLLESLLIADTTHDDVDGAGAVVVMASAEDLSPGDATVRWSRFERNAAAGVLVAGAQVVIEHSAVVDTLPSSIGANGHGVHGQSAQEGGVLTTLSITDSTIEGAHQLGVVISGGTLSLTRCRIADVLPGDLGHGDGVVAASHDGAGIATLQDVVIANSSRAAIGNFGAHVAIANTTVDCALFDLDGETYLEQPFTFDDQGGNQCGCDGESHPCKVTTTGLSPPGPIEG